MSYILDALRKSDQQRQRQRGAVPTLETLPVRAAQPRRPTPGSSLPLGAALLLAGVALGWWRPWEHAVPVEPQAASTPPAVAAAPHPPLAPLPVVAAPAIPASPTPASLASKTAPLPTPAPVALPVAPPAPAPATPSPPVRAEVAPELESLPAALRQTLPPLEISFLIDATAPLERRAMIDKTMLRPGESFGPGIFLEGITGDGVTLVYQGHRFRKRVHP